MLQDSLNFLEHLLLRYLRNSDHESGPKFPDELVLQTGRRLFTWAPHPTKELMLASLANNQRIEYLCSS